MMATAIAPYLTKLYKMDKCILVRVLRSADGIGVAPLFRGTFGEMVTKMYQYEPMTDVGVLTIEGKIYPYDYYPKNPNLSE
jgi:hypothetical protein